jgi:hypothetical protein
LPVHRRNFLGSCPLASAGQWQVGKCALVLNMQNFSGNVSFFFYATLMKNFSVSG